MVECRDDQFDTTYRTHYKRIYDHKFVKHASPIEQTDEVLISGHFKNNLQVNGKQKPSQTWPKQTMNLEEYKDFLKRLNCCKNEIYKLHFRCPDVNIAIIEQMLRDLQQTTYQYDYSPNVFVSRKDHNRLKRFEGLEANMKYYETTYGTYYNRIKEFEQFKDIMLGRMQLDDQQTLKNQLRKIYKTGRTTYHETICYAAMAKTRALKKVRSAPLDQYTLRRA